MEKNSQILIVSGLLYGDEGKGTTVEYLFENTHNCEYVVRFCGGPQAAHHIVTKENTWHCFSQFSSATFNIKSKTLLSKFMVVSPTSLIAEEEILRKKGYQCKNRIFIDSECFVVTPYHKMINRLSEIILDSDSHGSTGMGVGWCTEEAYLKFPEFFPLGKELANLEIINNSNNCLQINEFCNSLELESKLNHIKIEKLKQAKSIIDTKEKNDPNSPSIAKAKMILFDTLKNNPINMLTNFYIKFYLDYKNQIIDGNELIYNELKNNKSLIFEGAQGMLLDKIYGFYPHITKSICSDINVKSILNEIDYKYKFNISDIKIIKFGVLRCYSSRHGNGPFVSYDKILTNNIKEEHNKYSEWQGNFRVGYFDKVALDYGLKIFEPDFLVITCLDRLDEIYEDSNIKVIEEYKLNNNEKFCLEKLNLENHYKNDKNTKLLNNCTPIFNEIKNCNEILIDNKLFDKYCFKNTKNNFNLLNSFLAYINFNFSIKVAIVSLGPTKENKISLINY